MIVKRATLRIHITDHACERYAERVLNAPVSKHPLRRSKRIGDLRWEIYQLLSAHISGRHSSQYHLPLGDALFVIKDGALVTVKNRWPT